MSGFARTNIAASTAAVTNMSLTTYTVANSGLAAWGRGFIVTVTHTTVAGADTLGTLVVVGKGLFGEAVTDTITPLAGTIATGTKVFGSATSITSVGWVATSTADTIVVGVAAGAYLAQGGGIIKGVTFATTAGATVTIADAGGTMFTLASDVASANFDVPWSGFLKYSSTSTAGVTVIHSPGVPSTYAMA